MDRELTLEELDKINAGYPNFQMPEEPNDELSPEQMDSIIAGIPVLMGVKNAMKDPSPYRKEVLDRFAEEVIRREQEQAEQERSMGRSR